MPVIRPLQRLPDSAGDLPQGDGLGQNEKRVGRTSLLDQQIVQLGRHQDAGQHRLELLDQTQDPGVIYGLSEFIDRQGQRRFDLTVRKEDAPELDESITAEDCALSETLAKACEERAGKYLGRLPSILVPAAAASSPRVTAETLARLRAATRVDPGLFERIMAVRKGAVTQSLAVIMLAKAFAVPLCQERGFQPGLGDGPEFPYVIEAEERLVDALDKLKKNSNDYLKWALVDGRIVIASQTPPGKGRTFVMDQPVRVQINADTLGQALEQVEAACNRQHPDNPPFLADPRVPGPLFKRSPAAPGMSGKFKLDREGPLRDVALAVLDELHDPALCYMLTELELNGHRYFAFRVTRFDAGMFIMPKTGEPADPELGVLWREALKRVEDYLGHSAQPASGER